MKYREWFDLLLVAVKKIDPSETRLSLNDALALMFGVKPMDFAKDRDILFGDPKYDWTANGISMWAEEITQYNDHR